MVGRLLGADQFTGSTSCNLRIRRLFGCWYHRHRQWQPALLRRIDQPEVRMFYGSDIDFQDWLFQSHLTGDLDSGISSDYTYTAAVNMGSASTATINGVAFAAGGNNASTNSGTNLGHNSGFGSHGSDASLVVMEAINLLYKAILELCSIKDSVSEAIVQMGLSQR